MEKADIEKLVDTTVFNLVQNLLEGLRTRQGLGNVNVTDFTTLLDDLRSEKDAGHHKASDFMSRTRLEILDKKLVELDDFIKKKLCCCLVCSPAELKADRFLLDKYKQDVLLLSKDISKHDNKHDTNMCEMCDEYTYLKGQLENCEERIAELEARMKTLSARSNVFKDSVYLFLHKAWNEKYINNVDNTENTVTVFHIIIANLTILFQIGVYIFISCSLLLELEYFLSLDAEGKLEHQNRFEQFPTPDWMIYFTYLGSIGVLLGNLLPDILGVVVLRWKLWSQFLVILEVGFALGTALLLGLIRITTGMKSFLNLFLSIVGIIFIHSFDERIRLAMDTYGLLQQRSKVVVCVNIWSILVLLISLECLIFVLFIFYLAIIGLIDHIFESINN